MEHVVDPLLPLARLHRGVALTMIGAGKLLDLGGRRDFFASLNLVLGPGRWSIDGRLAARRPRGT